MNNKGIGALLPYRRLREEYVYYSAALEFKSLMMRFVLYKPAYNS